MLENITERLCHKPLGLHFSHVMKRAYVCDAYLNLMAQQYLCVVQVQCSIQHSSSPA